MRTYRERYFTKQQIIDAHLAAAAAFGKREYPAIERDGTEYLPELYRRTTGMSADILCSALFSVAKGSKRKVVNGKSQLDREYIERTFKTTNGASIVYRGKELRQDDLTVLLHLINLRAGMATTCEIEFAPYTFCSAMGWSDNAKNADRLRECLLRLRQAIVIVERDSKKGSVIGFVGEFQWESRERWLVQLDSRIMGLFCVAPTYLSTLQRAQLAEGLQTWLYGYVRANQCRWAVSLELIHAACGSESSNMKEFARSVREALEKLVAIGTIRADSTVKNGKVSIFKA
jgi:hypothetical protein